jgi:hypothetical protein
LPRSSESTESTVSSNSGPARARRCRASSWFPEPSTSSGWNSGHPRAFSPLNWLLLYSAVMVLR